MAAALAPYVGAVPWRVGLTDELRDLAKGAPRLDEYRRVGQGIHILDQGPIAFVTGSRVITWSLEEGFEQAASPVLLDRYFAVPDEDDWLDFDVDRLNGPLTYSLKEAAGILLNIVSSGWAFEDVTDTWVHSYLPFLLSIHSAFTQRPSVELEVPATGGQTQLLEGYYGGVEFSGIGGPFGPAVVTVTTEAGLTSMLADSAYTLVVDEAEPDDDPEVRKLLRTQRASAGGGLRKIRDRQDGSSRKEQRNNPLIMASTQGVASEERDAREWLTTSLVSQEGRRDPEQLVEEYLESNCIDSDEVRRTVFTGLLPLLPAIKCKTPGSMYH